MHFVVFVINSQISNCCYITYICTGLETHDIREKMVFSYLQSKQQEIKAQSKWIMWGVFHLEPQLPTTTELCNAKLSVEVEIGIGASNSIVYSDVLVGTTAVSG